jgi:hypothetical protein
LRFPPRIPRPRTFWRACGAASHCCTPSESPRGIPQGSSSGPFYFDQANESQLLAIGSIALLNQQTALGWKATERGLAIGGPLLHRMLLLRAELLVEARVDGPRCFAAIAAARTLAQQANDGEAAARASELLHRYLYAPLEKFSKDEIASVVDHERASPTPQPRVIKPRKKSSPKPKSSKRKSRDTTRDGGLFD